MFLKVAVSTQSALRKAAVDQVFAATLLCQLRQIKFRLGAQLDSCGNP